jgi:hypothetical protein
MSARILCGHFFIHKQAQAFAFLAAYLILAEGMCALE